MVGSAPPIKLKPGRRFLLSTTTDIEFLLSGRPYAERQFVMVADDAIVERTRLREQLEGLEARAGATVSNVTDWAKFAAIVAGVAFPPARVAALGVAGFEVAKRAIEAWGRASQNVDIHLVSQSEAKALSFSPGHPKTDVLYIGHPCITDRYCTAAAFHRLVFEHKFSEAITLLMALGATAIKVHHVTGWSKELLGGIALTVPVAHGLGEASAGGGMESSKDELQSVLLRAELSDGGRKEPFVPDGLVWYPTEHLWQMVAAGRIQHGLRSCQLAVTYTDDFGVNAEFHGALNVNGRGKAKLNLGGVWTDHTSTIWQIHADFGDSRRHESPLQPALQTPSDTESQPDGTLV